jgi:hypothetical protein
MHVGEPFGAAGLKRSGPLGDASDRKTCVAGRITVSSRPSSNILAWRV